MNQFVFVVCGEKKHIETLHFSLAYLKKFSKHKIIVLTDSARNEIPINHEYTIDISTPATLNHHQASIFLKTSIHRYLEKGNIYCYLDSDVIALNDDVDSIFSHYKSPISFAPDHCRINEFSPYAVKCNCRARTDLNVKQLENLIKQNNPYYEIENKNYNANARELRRILTKAKNHPLSNLFFLLKYFLGIFILPGKKFKLTDTIYFDKKNKTWCDGKGNVFLNHALNYYKQIQKQSSFTYRIPQFEWYTPDDQKLYTCTCNHLTEKIFSKFNVKITNNTWQHWNGGVFLFDADSRDFLETWHRHTMEIFEDPEWETRDQGTLALTVWEKGLQNHTTLKTEFNFLADFNNPMITYDQEKGFTADNYKSIIKPSLIHIYHNFGLKGWEIWDAVENIGKK